MRNRSANAGFSLLQLSILLTVGAMMLAALLPAGAADDVAKNKLTIERMEKIEAAAQRFMTANHRRPYPSSLIANFDATAFGIELTPPIDYSAAPDTHFTSALTNLASTTVTAGSKTLTVSSTSGVNKGWLISGTGIPSGTWIEAITSATTLTMSNTATASGTITASFRNPLVAGGVPTKSLGLPDEYAIDGFGRRIVYMVDSRATRATSLVVSGAANNGSNAIRLTVNSTTGLKTDDVVIVNNVGGTTEADGVWKVTVISSTTMDLQGSSFSHAYTSGGTAVLERNSCMALQHNDLEGALALSIGHDPATPLVYNFNAGIYDNTMWALMSYGKDGQGAVGIQGSALTSRIKTGNTDDSTLNNAFYDGTQTKSYAPTGLVSKLGTSSFDDIVWVNQATKNICGLGETVVSTRDFRIDGGGGSGATSAAFGDINGDGWQDIILGVPDQNVVRVIFGRKDNWPEPNAAYKTAHLDGNNGFSISGSGSFGEMVTTGDVNGDGYDDVIAGNHGSYFVIFGAASFGSNLATGSLSGSNGFSITGLESTLTSHVAVGDTNADGYDDILLPFDSGGGDWSVGLVYGKPSSWSNFTLNDAFLTGVYDNLTWSNTTGVRFNVTNDPVGPPVKPNATTGDVSFGRTGGSDLSRHLTAICDVNGDGFKDIIIPGVKVDTTITPQRIYVILGQSSIWSSLTSGMMDVGTHSSSKQLKFPTVGNGAIPTYDIKGLACKDINNDSSGYQDLLFYLTPDSPPGQEYIYAYYGRTSFSGADVDSSYDVRFNLTASAPSGQDNTGIPLITIGDLNNDGRNDIIISRAEDDPKVAISSTSFLAYNDGSGTTRSNAGAAYVLYQPSGNYSTGNFYGTNFFPFDDTKGAVIVGAASDGLLAQTITDMNKDGKNDLLLTSAISPGGAYLMFGKSYDTSSNTGWARGAFDLLCSSDKSGGGTYTHCPDQIKAK